LGKSQATMAKRAAMTRRVQLGTGGSTLA
jgi:hypothetical protein